MRRLIVNGDDFGASSGTNRGIVEAYERGILTSASLMVDLPAAEEAAELAGERAFSLGLHVVLTREDGGRVVDTGRVAGEIDRQLERFEALLRRAPTHLDSHHNVHFDPELEPCFLAAATRYSLPLRGYASARYVSRFYGQWADGSMRLDLVSVEALVDLLETDVGVGTTELGCHPGYEDPVFPTSYSREREAELRTLCDPAVRAVLERSSIRLISFSEL